MRRPSGTALVLAALAALAVILLAVAFAGQTTTRAADLPPCGPSERLPCRTVEGGRLLVVAVEPSGRRVVVPPDVFDDRLATDVNELPRPCFSGAEAC